MEEDINFENVYKSLLFEKRSTIIKFLSDPVEMLEMLQHQLGNNPEENLFPPDLSRFLGILKTLPTRIQQSELVFDGILSRTKVQHLKILEECALYKRKIVRLYNESPGKEQVGLSYNQVLLKAPWVRYHQDRELRKIFRSIRLSLQDQGLPITDFDDVRPIDGVTDDRRERHSKSSPFIYVAIKGYKDFLSPLLQNLKPEIALEKQKKTVKAFMEKFNSQDPQKFWIDPKTNDTLLHKAARDVDSDSLEFMKKLLKLTKLIQGSSLDVLFLERHFPDKIFGHESYLVNFRNKKGDTALHIAARNGFTDKVDFLCKNFAFIHIRNLDGVSPLEIMYLQTPLSVFRLLNQSLEPSTQFYNKDFRVKLQFRALLDATDEFSSHQEIHVSPKDPESAPFIPTMTTEMSTTLPKSEMKLLAMLAFDDNQGATEYIFPHVAVKTFLDLKAQNHRLCITLFSSLYILAMLAYIAFVVKIFVVSHPWTQSDTELRYHNMRLEMHPNNMTSRTYYLGNWENVWVEKKSVEDIRLRIWAYVHFAIGILFFIFELMELWITWRISNHSLKRSFQADQKFRRQRRMDLQETVLLRPLRTRRNSTIFRSFHHKFVLAYLLKLENFIQLAFVFSMLPLTFVVGFYGKLVGVMYPLASFTVLLAGFLILLQIGNLAGLGLYIQMFKLVLRKFAIIISSFIFLLISFVIALGILSKERFPTFPDGFFRVMVMLHGELSYDQLYPDMFPFPYSVNLLHLTFIMSVPIVLVNLLIGLSISEIQKLLETAEVTRRRIQVERLYMLEQMFFWKNTVIPPKLTDHHLQRLFRLELRPNEDVYVLDLPSHLHHEIRLLAESPEKYCEEVGFKVSVKVPKEASSSSASLAWSSPKGAVSPLRQPLKAASISDALPGHSNETKI